MTTGTLSFSEVKKTPIGDILDHYAIELTPRGSDLVGACPLCWGNGFKVSERKNVFNCFSCQTGGDVITFVAKKEGITLRQAAETILRIAQGHGEAEGDVQEGKPAPIPGPTAEDRLPASSSDLRSNPPFTGTLKLHPHPDWDEKTLEYFHAGACGRGMHRGRLAISLHDQAGNLTGFLGRGSDNDKYPRDYIRGVEVYNLHRVKGKKVILFEDIFEVWRYYEQQGREDAAALLGREISEEQLVALIQHGIKAVDLRIREMDIVSLLLPHFYVWLHC